MACTWADSWPGIASSARVLRQLGSPEGVFRASKRDLEACHLPSEAAEAVLKRKAFPRAEKELAAVRKIDGCSVLVQAEQPEAEQRNLLAVNGLNGSEKKLYELLSAEEPFLLKKLWNAPA